MLVVEPENAWPDEKSSDPYMGHCRVFKVQGTYSRAFFRLPDFATRESHRDALQYLEEARVSKTKIKLGWVGGGFHVSDPKAPCQVESRALWLYWEDEKPKAVMSFYDPV